MVKAQKYYPPVFVSKRLLFDGRKRQSSTGTLGGNEAKIRSTGFKGARSRPAIPSIKKTPGAIDKTPWGFVCSSAHQLFFGACPWQLLTRRGPEACVWTEIRTCRSQGHKVGVCMHHHHVVSVIFQRGYLQGGMLASRKTYNPVKMVGLIPHHTRHPTSPRTL